MPSKPGPRRPKRDKDDKAWQKKGKRKFCVFCKERIDHVDYKDVMTLRKFVSERGKIRSRRVTLNGRPSGPVPEPTRSRRSMLRALSLSGSSAIALPSARNARARPSRESSSRSASARCCRASFCPRRRSLSLHCLLARAACRCSLSS